MPRKNKSSNVVSEPKTITISILTVDPSKIEWEKVNQKPFFSYQLPVLRNDMNKWTYWQNWYNEVGDYPYYFLTQTTYPTLYVTAPKPKKLSDRKLEFEPSVTMRQDSNGSIHHAFLKTLLSEYLMKRHQIFINNNDFFIAVDSEEKDFITVLQISLVGNPHNPNEFFLTDKGTKMRRFDEEEIPKDNNWQWKNCYSIVRLGDLSVFRRVKPTLAKSQNINTLFTPFSNQAYKAQIVYHSVADLESLKRSRSYVVNKFLSGFIAFLNEMGLPFSLKNLVVEHIQTPTAAKMKESQIQVGDKPIYVVDNRLRPQIKPELEQGNFAEDFCQEMERLFSLMPKNDLLFEMARPTFLAANPDELKAGDYVLVIQDYEAGDFKKDKIESSKAGEQKTTPGGLLQNHDDPKDIFYKKYPLLVKQTITVNTNSRLRAEEKKKSRTIWTLDNYLAYDVPKLVKQNDDGNDQRDNSWEIRLRVCFNQLILKDIVMHGQNMLARFPSEQQRLLKDKVFMFKGSLMYVNGNDLIFEKVEGNPKIATEIIEKVTKKDLMRDILIPAKKWMKPYADGNDTSEVSRVLKDGMFIISPHYVWQIADSEGRVLYRDEDIADNLIELEESRSKREFYPKSLTDNSIFSQSQLEAYQEFLITKVKETFISYNDLKSRHGSHIKDEKGNIVEKDKGFYPLLGIKNDKKFKQYVHESLGLPIQSVRTKEFVFFSQGIWYCPDTQQYLVGSTSSPDEELERGLVLREIVVHQGEKDKKKLFELLRNNFFGMLSANFVRFRQYTVYPFPFNLIKVWNEIKRYVDSDEVVNESQTS